MRIFFAKYKKIPKSAISRVRKKRSRDRFLQNLVAGYMCKINKVQKSLNALFGGDK